MKSELSGIFARYKGRIAGVVVAALIGVLIFTVGFWATLLMTLLITAGYLLGKAADDGHGVGERLAELIGRMFQSERR